MRCGNTAASHGTPPKELFNGRLKLWDEAKLQRYINDEIEESLTLDYKASGSASVRN